MWIVSVIIAAVLAPSVLMKPQNPPVAASGDSSTPVAIVSQSEVVNGDGSFNFSYETGNGIKIQEAGFIKQNPGASADSVNAADGSDGSVQVLTGSFSYTAPDGTPISLSYTADENGFQPKGDHLPTPPPIPESVQKLLSSLNNAPQNAVPAGGALAQPQQPIQPNAPAA